MAKKHQNGMKKGNPALSRAIFQKHEMQQRVFRRFFKGRLHKNKLEFRKHVIEETHFKKIRLYFIQCIPTLLIL